MAKKSAKSVLLAIAPGFDLLAQIGALVDVAQAGPNGVCVCDDVGSLQVVAAVSTQGQMNIMLPYFHIVGHSELVEMLSVLK